MSVNNEILVIGAGGHARACIDVIESHGGYRIAGLVGLPEEVGRRVLGYSVIGVDNDIPSFVGRFSSAIIAVGQIKSPNLRIKKFEQLVQLGFDIPIIVSPNSYVSKHAQLGVGTIVMHGAIINAGVNVGRNCIINSMALLEHDVIVEDHCHISTSAALNSGVYIGKGTFIGSGSKLRQMVRVGERCVIGMGQNIIKNYEDETVLPSKVILN